MCEHPQQEAVAQGFVSIQYNLADSTDHSTVKLWKRHGFEIVGTLPKAFEHPESGYADAFVMYKQLSIVREISV